MEKRNGKMLMNRINYTEKMNKILKDISKFKKPNFDPNSNNYIRAPCYLKRKKTKWYTNT